MIELDLHFTYEQMNMHFQLSVKAGERIAVVGESGAGKSTLLNLIAGFEKAKQGKPAQLWLNQANHLDTEVAQHPVSMLFQDNNIFPHLTVEQNIGLALVPSLSLNPKQKEQVKHIATQMGIETLLQRQADQLSGGQKQRVALARTLLRDKPILLLDEPFSALDPQRRAELQQIVLEICQSRNLTLLMVTHQLSESLFLFNRVITVSHGKIISNQKI